MFVIVCWQYYIHYIYNIRAVYVFGPLVDKGSAFLGRLKMVQNPTQHSGQGDALRAAILIDTWGQGKRGMDHAKWNRFFEHLNRTNMYKPG